MNGSALGVISILFISSLCIAQDSTEVSSAIPAQSTIVIDGDGFRVLMTKERPNYQDAFYVRHSQQLDSNGLEVYLFRVAMAELSAQEDSTRFNELSDAYTAFTNLSIIEVRRMRVLTALQGDWTVTKISNDNTWQGTFTGDQFTIGAQTGTVTVETSRSIKIVGLSIGDLYLDAIDQNTLKSRDETYLFTRN